LEREPPDVVIVPEQEDAPPEGGTDRIQLVGMALYPTPEKEYT
jgi:hypothetical protein